jgi:hypothetical protein
MMNGKTIGSVLSENHTLASAQKIKGQENFNENKALSEGSTSGNLTKMNISSMRQFKE